MNMIDVERLEKVELLYREVNERIRSVGSQVFGLAGEEELEIVCECARLSCGERIQLTVARYDGTRESPARFVVLTGHEESEIERVVEQHPAYLVVEKNALLLRRPTAEEAARDTTTQAPTELE